MAPLLLPRLLTGTRGQVPADEVTAEEIVRALDDAARALPAEPGVVRP